MSEFWYPDATKVIPKNYTGSVMTRYEKQVLHTTESYNYTPSPDSYYGHQLWPHCTLSRFLGEWRLFQHLPLNRTSACMRNLQGGVETNRDGCIQIEIAWKAQDALNFPDAGYKVLCDWLEWVANQSGIPYRFVDDFHHYPPENGHRLGKEPWRLRGSAFDQFTGILGHQHADENVHGDPGKLNVTKLLPTGPEKGYKRVIVSAAHPEVDRIDVFAIGPNREVYHGHSTVAEVKKVPFYENLKGYAVSLGDAFWSQNGDVLTVQAQGKVTTEMFTNQFDTRSVEPKWTGWIKHPSAGLAP